MTPIGLSKNPTKKPLASVGYWRQESLRDARGGGGVSLETHWLRV